MERDRSRTRAWVLHPDIKANEDRRDAKPALDEAIDLAVALPDLDVVGSEIVYVPKAQAGLLFGSGKVSELTERFSEYEVELVLVDGPLTPVQQRNLEREWKVKILDRTGLILEIFSDRARTREGVLQVEVAALSYQRTRLVRAWTHLERQRGGLGFVGGPGETQIEADRRAIDEQLVRLRRQLSRVVKTRSLHRASRAKLACPIVALVGYTNAGKSTLFNNLTGARVMVKDMLFATLDPTMRRVDLPNGSGIILSDTVGFISDLPTELVAAFRATLEEVLVADLILHVRDIAHPATEEQARDVRSILTNLGVDEECPIFEVWNKIDLLSGSTYDAFMVRARRQENVFPLSAMTGAGRNGLLRAVALAMESARYECELHLTFADGRKRAWLFEQDVVRAEVQTDTGFDLTVYWTDKQKARFAML
ncbi:MAG: GTPase HflX [Rhodobacteraceae bacterium]|nr:GTPase HflX [Paracoccaceae bacterium]